MPETIRIVIIDDHPIFRAGMLKVLEAAAQITVVAQGNSGADALRLTAQHKPDVLVLDINLPDISGLEVTRRLHASSVPTAILILSVHDDPETVLGLLDAGAAGYVAKDDAAETLASAVRTVAGGERWVSPRFAGKVIHPATGEKAPEQLSPLTTRELEVLNLLARGLDNEAIAEQLKLTRRTVQNHVSAIYSKLGVASRAEAILYALNHKLVHVPPSGSIPGTR